MIDKNTESAVAPDYSQGCLGLNKFIDKKTKKKNILHDLYNLTCIIVFYNRT